MKTRLALLTVGILALTASANAQNAAAVFAKVSPSVVVVKGKAAQGSGVAVSVKTEGFSRVTTIVTNCHVVTGETIVYITHQSKTGLAFIRSCDKERDLALLELTGELPVVTSRSAASLTVGEPVYAVGAPRGLDLSISDGIVSQLRRDGIANRATPMIQTTAAISPGSSGGGLFDVQGRLVGITTLYLRDAQSLNFAIPSDWIAQAPTRPNTETPLINTPTTKQNSQLGNTGWEKFNENTIGDVLYIDRSTIKEQGRYRMMWSMWKLKRQQRDGANLPLYLSRKIRSAYECSTDRTAVVSIFDYSDAAGESGLVNSRSKSEAEWVFADTVPGSFALRMLQEACK